MPRSNLLPSTTLSPLLASKPSFSIFFFFFSFAPSPSPSSTPLFLPHKFCFHAAAARSPIPCTTNDAILHISPFPSPLVKPASGVPLNLSTHMPRSGSLALDQEPIHTSHSQGRSRRHHNQYRINIEHARHDNSWGAVSSPSVPPHICNNRRGQFVDSWFTIPANPYPTYIQCVHTHTPLIPCTAPRQYVDTSFIIYLPSATLCR